MLADIRYCKGSGRGQSKGMQEPMELETDVILVDSQTSVANTQYEGPHNKRLTEYCQTSDASEDEDPGQSEKGQYLGSTEDLPSVEYHQFLQDLNVDSPSTHGERPHLKKSTSCQTLGTSEDETRGPSKKQRQRLESQDVVHVDLLDTQVERPRRKRSVLSYIEVDTSEDEGSGPPQNRRKSGLKSSENGINTNARNTRFKQNRKRKALEENPAHPIPVKHQKKQSNRLDQYYNRDRCRRYRQSLGQEKRAEYNNKAKLRMRELRRKQKDQVKTRLEINQQRLVWREQKAAQIRMMSPEKKREFLQNRRNSYRRRQLQKGNFPKGIPESPKKFADFIENLLQRATPKKKQQLQYKGIEIVSNNQRDQRKQNEEIVSKLRKHIKQLRRKRKASERVDLKCIVKATQLKKTAIIRSLGMRTEVWRRYMNDAVRRRRSDAMPESSVKIIKNLYDENSVAIPDSKGKGRKILSMTTRRLHQRLKSDSRSPQVSLSKFRKLRPSNILLKSHHKFRTCLCEICLNMSYKAQALRQCGVPVNDKFDLVNQTLCNKGNEEFHKKECVTRTCEACGVDKVEEMVRATGQSNEKLIKWKKWETTSVGDNQKRKMQKEKQDTIANMLDETLEELRPFSLHLHTAFWQQRQLKMLADTLPGGFMLSVQDFAENYRHCSQDEVSSAFYNYSQSTLFTTVNHYKCPSCLGKVNESTVFLSEDLQHDPYFVKTAMKIQQDHWGSKGLKFNKTIIFSDGCSAQFKSRLPFFLLAKGHERAYFGTHHGKSSCDSLGGLVKNAAVREVAAGAVLSTTLELYQFCLENLVIEENCSVTEPPTVHNLRNFFLVKKNQIRRPQKAEDLTTIPGTRQYHHIAKVSDHKIKARTLACFCHSCLYGLGDACSNATQTGHWTTHDLRKPASSCKTGETQVLQPGDLEQLMKTLQQCGAESKRRRAAAISFNDVGAPQLNIVTCRGSVDKIALDIMPDNMPGYVPVVITADGNCLPRCASVVAYLTEENHVEMRLRIAVEMILHQQDYLSDVYLSRGEPLTTAEIATLVPQYCGQNLTKRHISRLYSEEVKDVLTPSTSVGLWQLFAMSSVLQRPVLSVFPQQMGNPEHRRLLNRKILPRTSNGHDTMPPPIAVLWSSTRQDMVSDHWVPNHFSLLVPISRMNCFPWLLMTSVLTYLMVM